MSSSALLPLLVLAACTSLQAASPCQPCHAAIVETYSQTGMGRSFFPMSPAVEVEDFRRNNHFLHKPSRSEFRLYQRDGRYYLRRESNGHVHEKEIHYVLGSGNHARSYVHRTEAGRLYTLPVSWYRGQWQMAPGFDRPDHPHFRRRITYDCFFCHNAYPQLPPQADGADPVYETSLPQGIDCARCHGDSTAHLAQPGKGNILNPRTLPAQRQLEVCLQCHLETSSHPQPLFARQPGRDIFSYRPEEPLANYMLHFDHPDKPPYKDKFEVVSAPYRLFQSACYLKSQGKLTCLTCHNPHQRPNSNPEPCRACHTAAHAKDSSRAAGNCVSCHMALRAPEDAPLTRFTDHRIARRPEKSPGPALPPYDGPWRIYWPPDAQQQPGAGPQPSTSTRLSALRAQARARFPDLDVLRKALAAAPRDPVLLTLLGEALSQAGRAPEAEGTLRAAIAADPDQPEAYVNLAALLARTGRKPEAQTLLRQALAIDPANPAALHNLQLLTTTSSRPR